MEFWREFAVQVILFLSVMDLISTYYYVRTYRKWQPNKPYNLIERNPLLCFLWNKLGLHFGMLIGSAIILFLIYYITRYSHWIIVALLGIVIIGALFNHYKNINLLYKLIEKYPSGHLPRETFGKVEGNNPTKFNGGTNG